MSEYTPHETKSRILIKSSTELGITKHEIVIDEDHCHDIFHEGEVFHTTYSGELKRINEGEDRLGRLIDWVVEKYDS